MGKSKKNTDRVRASRGRLLLEAVDGDPTKDVGKVIVTPEKYAAHFGRSRTGAPHLLGKVLDVGEDVKEDVKVGDYVLVDGMNANKIEIEQKVYYCPTISSVMAVVDWAEPAQPAST